MKPKSERLGPGDYRYKAYEEGNRGKGGKAHQIGVGVFHPETGEGVGQITAWENQGHYEVGTVYVRPEFRGQGVASTALNVANKTINPGTKARHSRGLSPLGLQFANRTPGEVPVDKATTPEWGESEDLEHNVRGWTNRTSGSRTFDSPTMKKAQLMGHDVEDAKYLTPAPPTSQKASDIGTQLQMFRKVNGQETPIKKAMPKNAG